MKLISLEPSKVVSIVLASCAFHNLLRKKNGTRSRYGPPGSMDTEKNDSQDVVNGNWRMDKEHQGPTPLEKVQNGKQSYSAKEYRE